MFPHAPVDGHLGCFLFGVLMNEAVMNFHVQDFVWTYTFISFS